MRALITGVSGFAGGHLAEYLAHNTSWELFGAVRATPPPTGGPGTNHTGRPALDPAWAAALRLEIVAADLNDYAGTRGLLAEIRPDVVVHLAAQAIVQRALADPEGTLINNIVPQLHLLRAMHDLDLLTRLLVIGSSEEYGHVTADDLPVD